MLVFNAVEPKVPFLLFFFMMLAIFIISTNFKYHFKVNENDLPFTISLFGVEILKRKASKENIKWIEFKRTDWHKKSVFIRLDKGFRWKISRFNPANFDEYLETFAMNHSNRNQKA